MFGPAGTGLIRFFAALADNVRDYAISLVNTDGVIAYWGEGARVIKWETKEEAEGAHLRLLYPAGGSEDGTAEEHLRQAAERGEYSGEGTRIRNDGSTFWAGVTLTALRDDHGALLGFAKVMRDLTARRQRGQESILATMSHPRACPRVLAHEPPRRVRARVRAAHAVRRRRRAIESRLLPSRDRRMTHAVRPGSFIHAR